MSGGSTAASDFEDLVPCGECGALNPPDARDCTECGAAPGGRGADREDAHAARHGTSRSLRQGYRWLLAVTWLYRLGTLAFGAVTTVAVVALMRTDVPRTPGLVVVAVMTALTLAMMVGALQIPFRPLLWTVVAASLATAATLVHALGPNPLGLAVVFAAAWAAVLWAAVLPTRRIEQLIAHHTDEYILHHASLQTQRSLKNRSPEERHDRLLKAMHRASTRAWRLAAIAGVVVIAGSALGSRAVLTKLRPEDFGEARARFERAWNSSSFRGIGALMPEEVAGERAAWLEGVAEGHGWGGGMPELSEGVRREGEMVWIDYTAGDVPVSAGWARKGLEWLLYEVDVPRPPLQDAIDALVKAWQDSDAGTIAGFVPPEYAAEYREKIDTAADNRGWTTFPEILNVVIEEDDDLSHVTLEIPHGEIETRWRFRLDGRWGLHAIDFPKLRTYRRARERAEEEAAERAEADGG